MKKTLTNWLWFLLMALTITSLNSRAQFDMENMQLLAEVPSSRNGTTFDLWGWTDSQTGTEYALMGHSSGVDIFDLSDPSDPDFRGRWTAPSGFDVKVFGDYAYAVNGGSGGSTHILSLDRVRSASTPRNFSSDATFAPSFHNIFINEDTGYLYGVSPSIDVYDLANPLNPVLVGSAEGRGHDAMSTTYHGPDTRYQGREILFGSQEGYFGIHDAEDKSNITQLSTNFYPGRNIAHQGWPSEDHQYFFLADESDINLPGSRTHIFGIADLESPEYLGYYAGPTQASDHNLYVKGDLIYLANYAAGTRVIRMDDPANRDLTEIASIDTYTPNNNSGFIGHFSVYPYFESGTLIASDMQRGLIVMRLDLGNDADFNDDGQYDCQDIDALVADLAAGSHTIEHDLTDDGLVTMLDLETWLSEAGELNLGTGRSYLSGDANLDGVVDVADFNLWNANKFTGNTGWCGGDFTADGVTDVADFNQWNSNKFQSSLDAVPEPDNGPFLMAFFVAIFVRPLRRIWSSSK